MACNSSGSDERQEDINEVLDLGIIHSSTDGTAVTHDLGFMERRQREQQANDPASALCGKSRPAVMNGRTPFRGY